MAVIDSTRTGSTGMSGKSTVLAPITGNGNNPGPVDGVDPDFANSPFLSVVRNHNLDLLKFLRKIFFQKALKPKQKVAMLAPTSTSSKLVRCSIIFDFVTLSISCLIYHTCHHWQGG